MVDPLVVNKAPKRLNIILGGHMRHQALKELGYKEVPAVYVHIADIEKEKELNLRLNKNQGTWDLELLAEFDESFLEDVGFSSEDLDDIFPDEDNPETFDLKEALAKLDITEITVQKGDVYEIGSGSRIMCGDSTIEADMLKLMDGEKADMCLTDEPYILDYLHGKKRKGGKATKGFGYKRDRQYLETDEIPDDFIEKWMANVARIQKEDFSIIAYEHPKNLKLLWTEMEKHWRYRNTIIWRVPNRVQGFAAKYKFFNKHDVALLGTQGDVELNMEDEDELIQNEYQNAIFATSGKPHWEPYKKGSKYCPTDFIEHIASDEKNSGQGVVFGTKPLDILIPYIKVLTKRGDLIVEPFSGSGSTLIASEKMGRRCYAMEKVPAYTMVCVKRMESLTGKKAKLISSNKK